MLYKEHPDFPEKKDLDQYEMPLHMLNKINYHREVGFNQALDLVGSLKVPELDEKKLIKLTQDSRIATYVFTNDNKIKIIIDHGKLAQALITAYEKGELGKL